MSKLTLDRANKKLVGVCAGLANWSGIDVTVMRLIFVIAALIGVGSSVLIYLILALVLD